MSYRKSLSLAMLLATFTLPAYAQQGTPDPKRQSMQLRGEMADHMGAPRMLSPEVALRLKEELKLTEAQTSQLEALRKEVVAERQAHARDMIDVESRVAAGLLKHEDVRKQFEDKGEAQRKTVEQRQDRIAKILTPEQQQTVQRATRRMAMHHMRMQGGNGFGRGRMQQHMRGRRGMQGMQGMRGMQGRRGMQGMRGMRGREGFGPGMEGGFAPRRPARPQPPRSPGLDD